jgi:hypothetical protein
MENNWSFSYACMPSLSHAYRRHDRHRVFDALPNLLKKPAQLRQLSFLQPRIYHDCLEGVEEYIEDKMEANYCDSFMLGEDSKEEAKRKEQAKARAEAFFNF